MLRILKPDGLRNIESVQCSQCRRFCRLQQTRTASRTSVALVACKGVDEKVDVLVIGSGGREHALAWKLKQSARADHVYCAPGNAGISLENGIETISNLDIADHAQVAKWCHERSIGLVAVGPEAPLVSGLCDDLRAAGIKTFGPSKAAAMLEGSKSFLKGFCERFSIPTAAYKKFQDPAAAKQYISSQGAPIVVKADGLAAGKGVVVAQSVQEAHRAVDDLLVNRIFGQAGETVVVEEFLQGEEVSFFAVIDGSTCLPLGSAQDHKAVGEGDLGPNTGGMGAYSPAPVMTTSMQKQVMEEIVQRTADGMLAEGNPFQGILFAGLMVADGKAKLLEHNVRFGDPECECLMLRLQSDLLELLLAAASGDLHKQKAHWSQETALTVIMASKGYPGAYSKGTVIKGVDALAPAKAFHCGTAFSESGELIANGGRVLAITACGDTPAHAQAHAYQAVDKVDWPGGFYRSDIGWRAIK